MLVVTEERAGERVPVGVLTDRDIVRAQLHRAADLNCLSVEEAMSSGLLVVGVISMDDLLGLVAQELSGLSQLVAAQPARERREHPTV